MRRRTYLATAGGALFGLGGCLGAVGGGSNRSTTPAGGPGTTDGTTGTTPALSTADPTPPASLRNGSFEGGLTDWSVGTDLPEDPNETTGTVDANAEATDEDASDGSTSLKLYVEGTQDDGTIWVQQRVDLSGVSTLAVDYLTTDSFNVRANAVAYAGPERSLAEMDFDRSNAIDGHEGGWKTFEYDVSHDGPGLVAVGMSVVWETDVTNYLDGVRLN